MTRSLVSLAGCLLLPVALLTSCQPDPIPSAPLTPNTVYTTFYPTTDWTRQIVGSQLEVVCPLPEDADAIYWQPSPEIIAAYQGAALVVVNGAEFEKWVEKVSLPRGRTVDTARGFEKEFVTYESVTHSHGPEGEHTHEGIDGHTWVDPLLAARQAEAILAALVKHFPAHEETFRKNHAELAREHGKKPLPAIAVEPHIDLAERRRAGAHRGLVSTTHDAGLDLTTNPRQILVRQPRTRLSRDIVPGGIREIGPGPTQISQRAVE